MATKLVSEHFPNEQTPVTRPRWKFWRFSLAKSRCLNLMMPFPCRSIPLMERWRWFAISRSLFHDVGTEWRRGSEIDLSFDQIDLFFVHGCPSYECQAKRFLYFITHATAVSFLFLFEGMESRMLEDWLGFICPFHVSVHLDEDMKYCSEQISEVTHYHTLLSWHHLLLHVAGELFAKILFLLDPPSSILLCTP